ncbi:canalicular multispecific organic anion transporter 1 [Aspergillus luchuensis]|uniref:Canalicular multispecific organic anion transporter 1 n=1 Tax=Aspergillus kawachii TaxID=1069201 RepID=A0A146FUZ9_ASPKA|nr:canalicular multispecific organic anion transporter 1 [Aspergillus luchuensis]
MSELDARGVGIIPEASSNRLSSIADTEEECAKLALRIKQTNARDWPWEKGTSTSIEQRFERSTREDGKQATSEAKRREGQRWNMKVDKLCQHQRATPRSNVVSGAHPEVTIIETRPDGGTNPGKV